MRATLLVLDSVGIGAMPDAPEWGDAGSDTLGHVAHAMGGLRLPNLAALGLGNIRPIEGVAPSASPQGGFGKMALRSDGKDTVTGHWEMAGCLVPRRFAFFPEGFPPAIIGPLEAAIGKAVLGNKAASGTEILDELGPQHLATGRPIVYTSADSVLQIAAHEDVVALDTLYAWCKAAFAIVKPHRVARIIARPFIGEPGAFVRTYNRKDFALEPHAPTIVDALHAAGARTSGIGKITSIFAGRGFDESVKAGPNDEVMAATLATLHKQRSGLVFSNLVDFDALYGHRRNARGYGAALERFDAELPRLIDAMGSDDLLLITADHGCDPTFLGSDHTREYVPLLVYQGGRGVDLGTRSSLADVAATLADWLAVRWTGPGQSFAAELGAA
jgi:phosphopentomutase